MNSDFLRVRRISFNIAKYMANIQKICHAQRYIYYYSLQIIIGSLFETGFILLLAWMLGIFYQMIVCIISFATVRFFAGGYHSDTYFKCFIITSILMFGITLFGIYIFNYYSIIINCLIFGASLFLTYRYAPCDTINKPVTSPILRKKLLEKAVALNLFWFAVSSCMLISARLSSFAPVIGTSILVEALTLTPVIASHAPLRKKCADTAH